MALLWWGLCVVGGVCVGKGVSLYFCSRLAVARWFIGDRDVAAFASSDSLSTLFHHKQLPSTFAKGLNLGESA